MTPLNPGDLVKVTASPGAPFDIGLVMTVHSIVATPLPILVKERPYRFALEWLEKVESGTPTEAMTVVNGHDVIGDRCMSCGLRGIRVCGMECPGAPA